MSYFQLISAKGVRADRPAIKGDYIRIDIPSTEPSFDRGYNWLRIVEIAQNMQSAEPWIALTLRPSGLPRSKDDDIEQFIDHSANSTLMIRRNGFTIYAQEYFGNKVPYKFGDDLYDRKPNLGIALAAKIGLSYIQWKMLVDRLLRD
ncbi:hypothetical protein [Pedobacter sp.]|uniref:hypothetical protein n=1 Tax=Pedobacter sp. TaxID=1411316 RepID=UPI003C43DD0E